MSAESGSRRSTDREEDIDEYVPDDATQAVGVSASEGVWTDDRMWVTGVHCTRCGCSVAVHDDGVVSCPHCGWRSDGETSEGGA